MNKAIATILLTGFVLVPFGLAAAPSYSITDLTLASGEPTFRAVDLNDAAQLTGSYVNIDGDTRAVRFAAGVFEDLGTLDQDSFGVKINESGVVLVNYIGPNAGEDPITYEPVPRDAFIFDAGPAQAVSLETIDINDVGELAGIQHGFGPPNIDCSGYEFVLNPTAFPFLESGATTSVFTDYIDGYCEDLFYPGNWHRIGIVNGLNNNGALAGGTVRDSDPFSGSPDTTEVVVWSAAGSKLLGKLSAVGASMATDINDHGVVVGWGSVDDSTAPLDQYGNVYLGYPSHAFIYRENSLGIGAMHDLGTLRDIDQAQSCFGIYFNGNDAQNFDFNNSMAVALNNYDQVIGQSDSNYRVTPGNVCSKFIERPFLYTNGGLHDLNDLLDDAAGWEEVVEVHAINEVGQILALARRDDGSEASILLTDISLDSDNDWLKNTFEIANGTNPYKADTDGDGVNDFYEGFSGLDWNDADSDDDGLSDGYETYNGYDPKDPGEAALDVDSDGATTAEEQALGTDPTVPDTDGDGAPDGLEPLLGMNPLDSADGLLDTDGDGAADWAEQLNGSNPAVVDSDGDGLWDGVEIVAGTDPGNGDDEAFDYDGDWLRNRLEVRRGTDIYLTDTDADGLGDFFELATGMNAREPLDALPVAGELKAYPAFKGLMLMWEKIGTATHYRVLVSNDGIEPFSQLGDDIPLYPAYQNWAYKKIEMPIHLTDWANARLRLEVCDAGGCSVVDATGIAHLREEDSVGYLKKPAEWQAATGQNAEAEFGSRFSMSDDGAVIQVIDAPYPLRRSVVYTRTSGNWYKPFVIDDSSYWGTAVSGDGNTFAVARICSTCADPESIEIYSRPDRVAEWALAAQLVDPDTGFGGLNGNSAFGYSMALSADGTTLLVGAYAANRQSSSDRGEIYTYKLQSGAWQLVHVQGNPLVGQNLDNFGGRVFMTSDASWMIASAYRQNALVFAWGGSNWIFKEYYYQALSPVIADDGKTMAFATEWETCCSINTGTREVQIWKRGGGAWVEASRITAPGNGFHTLHGGFGDSLALSADGKLLAISDPRDYGNVSGLNETVTGSLGFSGAVYIFEADGNSWSQRAYVKAPSPDAGDRFGDSIRMSPNGDVLAVGAPGEDGNGIGVNPPVDEAHPESGAIFLY